MLLSQGCVNNNTEFEKIQHLNDVITKNILVTKSLCFKSNSNLLNCFTDTNLEFSNKLSINEIRYLQGNLKDSYCISYKINSSLFKYRYFIYVYVNKKEEFNEFEYYEQFRDGLISSQRLNDNWLLCKMTNEI